MASSKHVPKLGLWILTALVAGNMIGSGIFLLPSSLATFGSLGLLAWMVTSVGAILLALVFAQMSRLIPKVGGPYAYCREGFGNCIGFLIAYGYWIAVWVGNAAIVVAFTGYLSIFWPSLATNNELEFLVSAATVWFVTLINIFGIRKAGIVQLVTTVLKLIPLILIAVVGLLHIHPEHYVAFNLSGKPFFTAFSAAASITLWSFIGLESATVPADSVADPEKTISRATIVGTILVAVIYIASTGAIMGLIPEHTLANSPAPYADAARVLFGHWGEIFIALGALIACFGALNGWTLLAGQIPMAAARDNLFPKLFARQTRYATPQNGLIISSCLVTLLLLFTLRVDLVQQFTFIILLATLSSLIPYFFTAMAELMLLFKNRDSFSRKRLGISISIASFAGLYAFWAISGAGKDVVYYGVLLMLSGLPVYVWVRWRIFARAEAEKIVDIALGNS